MTATADRASEAIAKASKPSEIVDALVAYKITPDILMDVSESAKTRVGPMTAAILKALAGMIPVVQEPKEPWSRVVDNDGDTWILFPDGNWRLVESGENSWRDIADRGPFTSGQL